MKKLYLSFIILVGILFLGIVIMIKPTIFASSPMPSHIELPGQPMAGRIVPKEVILLGAGLIIAGVIGLTVLGFTMFKDSGGEDLRTQE